MENVIKIASGGKKTINLVDEEGVQLGRLVFDPGDMHIASRFVQVSEAIKAHAEKINTGKSSLNERAAEIEAYEKTIREQFNFLLGYDATSDIFGKKNALYMNADGSTYYEQVLAGLSDFISAEVNSRTDAKRAKINAVTAKYTNKNS